MQKPGLSLGGVVIFLTSVLSLHLSARQWQPLSQFAAPLQAVTPSPTRFLPWTNPGDRPIDTAPPSPADSVAPPTAPPTAASSLRPTAIASAQLSTSPEHIALTDWVDGNFFDLNTPGADLQSRSAIAHPAGIQPIFNQAIATIGFWADVPDLNHAPHSPSAAAQWQYFDPAVVESLTTQRRLVTEAAADTPDHQDAETVTTTEDGQPSRQPAVAPGGGQYWSEDPDAAWW